jgi:spermidine synthase
MPLRQRDEATEAARADPKIAGVLVLAFSLTGLTALAAEVILNRLLAYVFGSSHWATATVLAAYMGGLSLGTYLFGRLAPRIKRPIATYAMLELMVALFYAAAPLIYPPFRSAVVEIARTVGGEGAAASLLRFAFAALFVLIPTILVGGTLPLLVSASAVDPLGRRLPLLYAVNALGAAAGTLVCAYLAIPTFGLDGTLALCAVVNVAVATSVLLFVERRGASVGPAPAPPAAEEPAQGTGGTPGETIGPVGAVAFAQGAVAFTLEVVWTHVIGTVIGVTVHAFAIMLAAILLGIGLGSAAFPALRRRLRLRPSGIFILAQACLAGWLAASLPLWDRFPQAVNACLALKAHWAFAEREVVRLAWALALLVPGTFCLGLGLPALTASARAARDTAAAGRLVGRVFSANTLGAIVGALVCGFWLLGRVPSSAIVLWCSGCALVLAAVVYAGVTAREPRLGITLGGAGVALAVVALAWPGWDAARLTAGSHYYWQRWSDRGRTGSLVFFAEDPQVGFVTVERGAAGLRIMKTNGKYEGSDAVGEFQDYLSLIAALYTKRYDEAFLLGLGPGRSLALLHELPFRRIEVAEYSPSVLRAAREIFPDVSGSALQDPDRVHLAVDDGRNRLQLGSDRLDLVAIGITAAAFAGSGAIYSKDFYEIVQSRLAADGVFAFWLQGHHLDGRVVQTAVATLRSVFPHVHVYQWPHGGQYFLVASGSPLYIDSVAVSRLSLGPRTRAALAAARLHSLLELASWSTLTTDGELDRVARPRAGLRLHCDLDPAFEYAAAVGLASEAPPLDLRRVSDRLLPEFRPPLTPGMAAGYRGLALRLAGENVKALEQFRASEALLGQPVWQAEIESLANGSGRTAP